VKAKCILENPYATLGKEYEFRTTENDWIIIRGDDGYEHAFKKDYFDMLFKTITKED
jgi:hypothetical protein